ncbi:MAG TPA: hypothetical protein VK912_13995 [Longimicrobiales bacterium]|nr:hypothetical protein [Longimicrobiales bacterium]
MNDDEIRATAEGLAGRGGLKRLLLLLGFTGPPRSQNWTKSLRTPARAVHSVSRETLRAHVVELRGQYRDDMLRDVTRAVRSREPLAHHVLVLSEPRRNRVIIACDALNNGVRHAVIEPSALRHSDIDTLRELAAQPSESGTAAALRIHRALDRRRLTTRFFRDIRGVRDTVARSWTGLPARVDTERDALALLLISRLMFLYFLQQRGLLDADSRFLPRLLARWRRRTRTSHTFYRAVLHTLFFGVLNRHPAQRTARALALGDLPYLNGGLFEKHALEQMRPELDIDDDVITCVFDALLEKYRFTSGAPGSARDDSIGAGIDPEMLGRIFEGLMPQARRSRTGTFYTPPEAVDALVVNVLAAHVGHAAGVAPATVRSILLRAPSDASDRDLAAIVRAASCVRVLDPACGSGAFLMGVLDRLETARCAAHDTALAGADVRRDIVARSLHGVDLLEDAALICSLRLWLALIPGCDRIADVPPLPNLDRRIRQGDALVDPLDMTAAAAGRPLGTSAPPELRVLVSRLEPASRQYVTSSPEDRPALRRALQSLERRFARAWLDTLRRQLEHEARELRARAADTDLFGEPTAAAVHARTRLPPLTSRLEEMHALGRDIRDTGALPFFSFRVHFAETEAFDVVLSNPPWVRAHNWPAAVRTLLRERYRVCADAGWPYAASLTATPHAAGAQVDLAFLFLERSLRLLRVRGTLGMVLPAKLFRSLAPGGARALLLGDTHISSIEDHSLDQRAVFDADAFTAVVIAQRVDAAEAGTPPAVSVRMTRSNGDPLEFVADRADLPLRPGDVRSPWLLAPPGCAAALRRMQGAGRQLGESGLSVRRGAMTGANDVMIVHDVQPRIGDLAHIRAEGYYRPGSADRRRFAGHVEASALRPVLRGTDVKPWRTSVERHVLWTPANHDPRTPAPRRLAAFLARHSGAFNKPAHRLGTLQRLSPGMYGHKVVWSDLASDLRAAAVPASIRTVVGTGSPIVPLNTVYFIGTRTDRDALLLAAYFNSMPVRTFARAIAERAKDAHFRFFAWTIAMLPLPMRWRDGSTANRILHISLRAHRDAAIEPCDREELDRLVAHAYGLDRQHIEDLVAFDAWLSGKDSPA